MDTPQPKRTVSASRQIYFFALGVAVALLIFMWLFLGPTWLSGSPLKL